MEGREDTRNHQLKKRKASDYHNTNEIAPDSIFSLIFGIEYTATLNFASFHYSDLVALCESTNIFVVDWDAILNLTQWT
ncbi:hypothetical protein RJT34_10516 [Clitoria ternatea]|uniref:Uncharacterized protein n=1 Tax=Clitoria ternatea TaxID=43366 RepID=A0AAN9K8Q3_CLITE